MLKKTIFLVHDEKENIDLLKKDFSEDKEFEIVGESFGDKAVEMIVNVKPHLLILDVPTYGNGNLQVVQKIKQLGVRVKTMMLAPLSREEVIREAFNLGIDYFMVKPYNAENLKRRIVEMVELSVGSNRQTRNSLDERISNIFINAGIPPHVRGYAFLRDGVKFAMNEPETVNNITKQLYPKIGEKYNTTASKVERAIRHAIEVAWSRGRIEDINNLLGVKAFVGKEKPTNSEFIALVADKMLLEQV